MALWRKRCPEDTRPLAVRVLAWVVGAPEIEGEGEEFGRVCAVEQFEVWDGWRIGLGRGFVIGLVLASMLWWLV